MATPGKFKNYDKATLNFLNSTLLLGTATIKAILGTAASNFDSALTTAEVYADLTGELTTANGYTSGGLTVTSVTLTRTGTVVTFSFAAPVWSAVGGSIAADYFALMVSGTVNSKVNPLIAICVADTTAGHTTVTATAGNTWTLTPSGSGVLTFTGANTN